MGPLSAGLTYGYPPRRSRGPVGAAQADLVLALDTNTRLASGTSLNTAGNAGTPWPALK